MAAAMSPSTSPRLPSPPPLSEDFTHPKSPSAVSEAQEKLENVNKVDYGASRRIRPGTKAADMAEGPPLVELAEIDSAFQLTEHLKALHNAAIHPQGSSVSTPIDRPTALSLAQPPEGVDRTAWLYELCRFLCQKINSVLIALFDDHPPCSATTCPEMRASEWQYLCAVHDPPKSCCAIDYCCHTLDWAATTLTSPKNFPSRLAFGSDSSTHQQQARQLTNVFRRVYRIFAHAWFQHKHMFWKVESSTGLYILFKTVCDVYQLIPEDNYTIPPEAEGLETRHAEPESTELHPQLLKRTTAMKPEPEEPKKSEEPASHGLTPNTAGNTTKRHRHSPSSGATSVDTVIEEIEEEEDPKQCLSRQDTIREETAFTTGPPSEPETLDETKPETQEVPKQEENAATSLEEDTPVVLVEDTSLPQDVDLAKEADEPAKKLDDSKDTNVSASGVVPVVGETSAEQEGESQK